MNRSTTKLLDLSDDTLTRILTFLFGPNESLELRSLSEARNAFALAVCNRRLLDLFRHTIRRIDASGVPFGFPRVFSPVRLPRYEKVPHLAAVARLAGDDLHVMRLPNARYSKVGGLLSVVAQHCPRLQEVAYFDDGTLSEYVEQTLFSPDGQLTCVEIINPRTVLKALISGPFLSYVTLLNVREAYVDEVIVFLRMRGRDIRRFRLSISSADTVIEPGTEEDRLKVTRQLMGYVKRHVTTDLPNLESLDLAPCIPETGGYATGVSSPDEFSRFVSKLKTWVGESRARNCGLVTGMRLNRLVLQGSEDLMSECLQSLDSFIFEDTEVELQFPGATIVFPASRTVESDFFVKTFCFDALSKYYAASYESRFHRLESLTFKCYAVVADYESNEVDRETLSALAKRAGPSLRHLRFCLDTEVGTSHVHTCHMVCNILHSARNVTYLELPRSIVELATRSSLDLMLSLMSNVRVIRLYSPFTQSFIRQRVSVVDLIEFSRALPLFLKKLASNCPKLQCLYMNMSGSTMGKPKREALGDLDLARAAVKEFEAALPQVDARSVSAELERWAISGMNPASLSAPFLYV